MNKKSPKLFADDALLEDEPKKERAMAKIAFFDIDGTIFRSSLLIELINDLVEKRIFPKRAEEEIKEKKLAWLDRVGKYDDYLYKVVEIHLKYIKGCREADVMKTVDDIMYFEKDRVYRFTRDLIKKLKADGYMLVAISSSPEYLVKEFAAHMGFDRAFGQILEVEDGIFTGKIVNDDFRDKESIINGFLAKENLQIDFKNSVAVGDTDNDISMLKMVGRPIAFNPNKSFAEYAQKSKWRIVTERKDAIYDLKEFDILPYEGMDAEAHNL